MCMYECRSLDTGYAQMLSNVVTRQYMAGVAEAAQEGRARNMEAAQ